MKKYKLIISAILCIVFFISVSLTADATFDSIPETTDRGNVLDMTAETIISKGKYTEKEGAKIREDVELLNDVDIPVEHIKEVSKVNSRFVYLLKPDNTIVDKITIEEKHNGDILMNVTEFSKGGEKKHDELLITADGTIFLDGKEVIYETVTSEKGELSASVGGYTWYSAAKAPSKMKKAKYNKLKESWRCSSIKLQKALGSIAYSTIITAIGGAKNGPVGVAAGAASGFATSTFLELVNYDRKSQCISYITYGARAKNNARYIKQKTFTYPHKGFKPNKKHTTSYSYGLVI